MCVQILSLTTQVSDQWKSTGCTFMSSQTQGAAVEVTGGTPVINWLVFPCTSPNNIYI